MPNEPRFLLLSDVAEILNISASQAYALVRSGDLPSMQVGGRKQYRIAREALEQYIADAHRQTAEWVRANPLGRAGDRKG